MKIARFAEVNPLLSVPDVEAAIQFYTERLGFRLSFRDCTGPANYAGVRRDGVELHFQWNSPEELAGGGKARLRFIVDDPDALFEEYKTKGVFHDRTEISDKPWGTREFAFYDLNGNGLTFYRDL